MHCFQSYCLCFPPTDTLGEISAQQSGKYRVLLLHVIEQSLSRSDPLCMSISRVEKSAHLSERSDGVLFLLNSSC